MKAKAVLFLDEILNHQDIIVLHVLFFLFIISENL